MQRSPMNRAILLGATNPTLSVLWVALAVYVAIAQHSGWLFLSLVSVANAVAGVLIRRQLFKEECK